MRFVRVLFIVSLALLTVALSSPAGKVHGQSISRVYIAPLSTPGTPYTPNAKLNFSVSVMLDLASGENINGFNLKLNYSGWRCINCIPPSGGSITADQHHLNYTNNIFGSSGSIYQECIDGTEISGNCDVGDTVGQVHLTEFGDLMPGGRTYLLFTQLFDVWANGTSVFSISSSLLTNPGSGNYPVVSLVQYVSQAGVFGNKGLVAFFNYQPSIPPAILPGSQVSFNSTGSFNADNGAFKIVGWSWDFGDNSGPQSTSSLQHIFYSPGNYSVTLTVTDDHGNRGSVVRIVNVVPALGSLLLFVKSVDVSPLGTGIVAQLINSTTTVSRSAPGPAFQSLFTGLSAGVYTLKVYGPTLENLTKTTTVIGGWESLDTAWVTVKPAPVPPPDYSGLIFGASMLAGVGAIAVVVLRKSLRRDSKSRVRAGRPPRESGGRYRRG